MFCTFFCQFGFFFAEKGEEHNGFALEQCVSFQFGNPVSVGMLMIEEKLPRCGNTPPEFVMSDLRAADSVGAWRMSGGRKPGGLIHIIEIRFHSFCPVNLALCILQFRGGL